MKDTQRGKPLVVVMGVSASGKSTVGRALAVRLDLAYVDGDAFHSQANIDKMSAGIPLNDEDRRPWLDDIGTWLGEHRESGGIVGCSALKRRYRDRLRGAAPNLKFLHLNGGIDVLRQRIAERPHHFMPASLLDSQLETLEPLQKDEPGIAIELSQSPDTIVDAFLGYLGQDRVR